VSGATGPAAGPGGGTNPGYTFSPPPSASGASPSSHFLATDLTIGAGQQLVAGFAMASPGSVSLHGFPAGTGGYDIGTLRACLEFKGQAPCSPAPFPNPAYWTVSADDLAHHGEYQLRVSPTLSSGALLGIDLGWNGSHHTALSGFNLRGGCSAAATGYQAGCGLRLKINGGPGTAAVSAGPGLLHLKVKDKSTGTVACPSTKFTGSTTCALPDSRQWTFDLYPENGVAISPASITIDWP
jgi:hypothetical protein